MKSVALWTLLLVAPALAHANDGGGQPLACTAKDTFFPRGDHWAEPPNAAVTLRFQPDGPTQTAPQDVSGALANQAVQNAFGIWIATACPNPPNSRPNLRFALGQSYPNRDRGDDPNNGVFNNIIYWVVDPAKWMTDTMTVALSTDSYTIDTRLTVNADMEFNGVGFQWRTPDPATGAVHGCVSGNPNCYDIETVALHEVGHFIGLNHVACQDAVMYPSAGGPTQNAKLSHHEIAGLCAVYPPRPTGAPSQMGELCTAGTDCAVSLTCLKPATGAANVANGWCAQACKASTDCSVGWVCRTVNSQGNVCMPGVHLAGQAVADVAGESDLCAPCQAGSQCSSGLCVFSAPGVGICSQPCSRDGSNACPANFGCTPTSNNGNVCWPVDETVCANLYYGAVLNDVCYVPPNNQDPNSALKRVCAPGLVCFVFPGGIGQCLNYCSATDPAGVCAPGTTCCFGTDSNGYCAASTATQGTGGCIEVRQVGESCTEADKGLCEVGAQCFYTKHPTAAECYRKCDSNNTCGAGEVCNTFQAVDGSANPLCCDKNHFNASDPTTCVPKAALCKRDVGVECSTNEDCKLGLCEKVGNRSACSVQCNTSKDCPGVNDDVNGDGTPDGGGSCQHVGSQNLCWPNQGPASLPTCAVANNATANPNDGCNCAGASTAFVPWLALFALARRRRRTA